MSSILEALRELEGSRAPATQDAVPWTDRPRRLRRAVAALVVVALAAAAGVAVFLRSRGAPSSIAQATSPQAAQPASALPLAAPAPPLPPALLDADPPRGQVASRSAGVPSVADAPERPAPGATLREPGPYATASRSQPGEAAPRPPGEPRVQLSSITYSPVAERRAVALTVNGGPVVTLHEGESASDVEVQLILHDRVYVRHAGHIFAVDARN